MLSKTLQTTDYPKLFPYTEKIKTYKNVDLKDASRFDHPHRWWEYSLIYKVIAESKQPIKTILDVGGDCSLILPLFTYLKYDVTGIDPEYDIDEMKRLEAIAQVPLNFRKEDFLKTPIVTYDAVVCVSVMEHVQNHWKFFTKLLDSSNNLVCLTVDFHPSGEAIVQPGHLRTYNAEGMETLISKAEKKGFFPIDGYDYSYFEPNVQGCTFASLILEKK